MTTITDAYRNFSDMFGAEPPDRTRDELRNLVHDAGIRYEEIGEAFWDLAFGDPNADASWAHGTIDEPTAAQWTAFGAAQDETA